MCAWGTEKCPHPCDVTTPASSDEHDEEKKKKSTISIARRGNQELSSTSLLGSTSLPLVHVPLVLFVT